MSNANSRTIFIGNISYEVNEDDIAGLCSGIGPTRSVKLVQDKETGKPHKGFAFVEFLDNATAVNAMRQIHGLDFKGRMLRVDLSEQNTTAMRGGGGGGYSGRGADGAPSGSALRGV